MLVFIQFMKKTISSIMRLVAGILATTYCLGAASGAWGIVGTLAALSYTVADGFDLYGMIMS